MAFSTLRAALCFTAALTLSRSSLGQTIDSARTLFQSYRYAEAKARFQELRKSAPNSAEAAYYLGRIAAIEFDDDEAVRNLEDAVQLDSANALYYAWLGNVTCDAAMHARIFRQPILGRRVGRQWTRAVELDPNLLATQLSLVRFSVVAPGVMGGGMDKARKQAAIAAVRSPLYGALTRAAIAESEKNFPGMVSAYEQGITATPDSLLGYVFLAEAYARDGKGADALATLDRYAARHPADRWPLFHTGRMAAGTGQWLQRGQEALEKFLSAPPPDALPRDLAEAHYRLAQLAERRGQADTARNQYRIAEKINPRVGVYTELRWLSCR